LVSDSDDLPESAAVETADPFEAPGLGLDEPPQPQAAGQAYRVLARKYRPQSFEELIGQEAMVQTLANAIRRDRIAHAFLLTGVRGVGKTSTARLIAKALNCIGPDGKGGPTIEPCGQCEPCRAIAEGRHIDVIEMDAASNRGIDDAREIREAVRYAAVSARYKIYIIDEVHMLTREAFNALLKTLEEPPPHVKFLLATTEVSKIPVTVLSRCQRFDLRRIPADRLAAHFAAVAQAEGVAIDEEALALIARAAEGSARDGLSMLDQAIARGGPAVSAEEVRVMLGLSDRGAVRTLLGRLLEGDQQGVLAGLREQYDLGVEPASLIRGLLEAVHGITRAKVGSGRDPAQSQEERDAYAAWAGRLSHAAVHRLWQMLLRGLAEIEAAPLPFEAAEMALLRVLYSSELPDPGALVERLTGAGGEAAPEPRTPAGEGGTRAEAIDAPAAIERREPAPAAAAPAEARPQGHAPRDFRALVEALAEGGKAHLAQQLHDYVSLVRYAPPELVLRPLKSLPGDFARDLGLALGALTGTRWQASLADAPGEPSLLEQEKDEADRQRAQVLASPVVKAAFEAFPEAELAGYRLEERESREDKRIA
jgi:DNA polymerase-3 subunit gamma/tau